MTPQEGWRAWGQAEKEQRIFPVGIWSTPPISELGINSSADTTNRLTVASDATLLTHDGTVATN